MLLKAQWMVQLTRIAVAVLTLLAMVEITTTQDFLPTPGSSTRSLKCRRKSIVKSKRTILPKSPRLKSIIMFSLKRVAIGPRRPRILRAARLQAPHQLDNHRRIVTREEHLQVCPKFKM